MIQPWKQDKTGTYQRKEGWVVDKREEEKQTEVRVGWVSQLLSCRGRGAGACGESGPAGGTAQNAAH